MKLKMIFSLVACILLAATACKKEVDPHIPPDVVFKTTSGYTYTDSTVGLLDTFLVGIVATRTEDAMKSYNVSHAYDGATSTTTFYNYLLTAAESESYSHDIEIVMRNQPGTERWVFTIVDRDGNVTQKTLLFTVQ